MAGFPQQESTSTRTVREHSSVTIGGVIMSTLEQQQHAEALLRVNDEIFWELLWNNGRPSPVTELRAVAMSKEVLDTAEYTLHCIEVLLHYAQTFESMEQFRALH